MSAAGKLAQVLAEHTICWNGAFGQWGCTGCDATYESHEYCYAEDEHAAHQAAVVLAHLTAAYPHVFAAVVEALRDEAEAEDDAEPNYQSLAVKNWLRDRLARIAQEGQP